MSAISNDIIGLSNLTSADFSYNGIAKLPAELFKMANLQNFDITNNEIVELPEIDSTCQFRSFDISNNKITKLPNSINNLKGLSRFTLKNNKLTTIPAGIGSISRLNTLDLTNNPLESLPIKELRKLQDLRQLFIMEKPEPIQEK